MIGSFWFNSFSAGGGGAAADYELISTTVLGSSAASVTFSGLGTSAAAYKHLQLRIVAKSGSTFSSSHLRFNSDSGANYSVHELYGSGSAVGSLNNFSLTRMVNMSPLPATANVFGAAVIDILDFASSSKNKTVRSFRGFADSVPNLELVSGAWYSTASITNIELLTDYTFATGSRFSLYGLK